MFRWISFQDCTPMTKYIFPVTFPLHHNSHNDVNTFNNNSSRIIFQQSPPTPCTHQSVVCKLLPDAIGSECEQYVDKFLRVARGVNIASCFLRIYPRPFTASRLSSKFVGFYVDNMSI